MSKIQILILEDNPAEQVLLKEYLATTSFELEIHTKTHLQSTLDFLKKNDVDVLICDLNLPDSYGIETFLKISSIYKELPIIVTTNLTDNETASKLIESGAEDYLFKRDITERSIQNSIRNALARSKKQRTQYQINCLNYKVNPVSFYNQPLKDIEPEIYQEFLDLYKLVIPSSNSISQDQIKKKVNEVFLPHIDAILMLRIAPNDILSIHEDTINAMDTIDTHNPNFRKSIALSYFYTLCFLYKAYSEVKS